MMEVHWKSIITGYEGHGKPYPDHIAEEISDRGNRNYPTEIYHWTVKAM